ncbi:MAG: hypothetical protein HY465_00340 [Deltaproteobacteria bacterium]|nr:hypothetical protein [Deltaproteobacteria bacterium]
MKRPHFSILISLLLLSASCSLQKAAASAVGGLAWNGQTILEQESDVEAARLNTPPLIASLAVFAENKRDDRHFGALLAKAYGQYAYGFYEEDLLQYSSTDYHYKESLERANRFYERGKAYGLRGLSRKSSFHKALTQPIPDFERSLRSFKKKDVPLLFWTAFCWGGWVNLHRDDPDAIAEFSRVVAMIDRVMELEPTYASGSALSFRAVLDASRPPMLGGNPKRAKELFDQAVAVEPRFLMTKVLFAQYYAVQVQDQKLFVQLLSDVAAADAAAFPEQRLANELAKRRATLLLGKAKLWF